MSTRLNLSEVLSITADKKFDESFINDLKTKGIVTRQVTTDENLKNLYLLTLDKSVEGESSLTALQQQCNGIILEKDSNRIVAANQNHLVDVTPSDFISVLANRGLQPVIQSNNESIRAEYCEDGTIMRLYNYQDTWCTATTRCITACDSFWSSEKTFDQMFWEVFDRSILETLDKSYTYLFVLLHSENRIVVKHNYNSLVFVSRIHNQTLVEDFKNVFYQRVHHPSDLKIKRPRMIPYVNLEDFPKYYFHLKRGVLVKLFEPETGYWTVYKLDFDQYRQTKQVRGNVPQIRMRFLELLNDSSQLMMLEKYYPEYKFMFTVIKNSLMKVTREIHKLYVDSHIKHTVQIGEDHLYYRTLRQLHAQYKTTNKPINIGDVESKLFSLDKNVLKTFLGWV
ncbi:MAG: hypothetical protein EBU90_15380 [Proteobacteria bacterium]|nr:hypothetical protein [Pseudomonadota bacterium]NBP15564.1 hypothetical protein [bacterium]